MNEEHSLFGMKEFCFFFLEGADNFSIKTDTEQP